MHPIVAVVWLALASCYAVDAINIFGRQCKVLDMTHDLKENIPVYPIGDYLRHRYHGQTVQKGVVRSHIDFDPYFLHYGSFSMMEHIGTHVDAPLHVLKDDKNLDNLDTIESVPFERLSGEACVIDLPPAQRGNRDYRITIEDLANWEREHGPFHKECVVLVRSGMERFWPDENSYLGVEGQKVTTNYLGNPNNLHWPGLDVTAADWLLKNRGMLAIGQDAVSFDAGTTIDWANSVHALILGANLPGFENLAQLSKLPNRGATIFAAPLRLEGKSGSPARIFAIGWDGDDDPCRHQYDTINRATTTLTNMNINLMLIGVVVVWHRLL